ncbi:MAG TPA: amino acid adenylation domain-containing protein [Vicinamibacterales bacterium]|nr:amino acid adenylation domain-containing protein [Vicinamibacterales bacterium]
MRFAASFAQERLWFLDRLEPGSAAYNIPAAIRLSGPLRAEALNGALREVVRRHEALRTTFTESEGRAQQVIDAGEPCALCRVDVSELPETGREKEVRRLARQEAARPFDLSRGPLMRATLIRLADQEHALLLTMHHIVSDVWSIRVLLSELSSVCETFSRGRPSAFPELPIQYADYAHWQRQWLQGDVLEAQLSYWRDRLRGAPRLLELPADRPRPAVQSTAGATEPVWLPRALSEALVALSRREGATLFMTLLAAFQALLHRYADQEKVLVGTPIAGRTRTETEGLIGLFVNTLVLRADVRHDMSFQELLAEVRVAALGAYANQDLPFEKLVEELEPIRDLGKMPLFQAMFIFQNTPQMAIDLAGLKASALDDTSAHVRSDLDLYAWESGDGIRGTFVYRTDLFEAPTIARLCRRFITLLESIVRDPAAPIDALRLDPDLELASIPLSASHDSRGSLSYHQERMWFIDQFETGNVYESHPVYHNLPLVLHFQGGVDADLLQRAINLVTGRHDVLRTRFVTRDGHAYQEVVPHTDLELNVRDVAGDPDRDASELVVQFALEASQIPIALDRDRLIRATLFRLADATAVLVVTVHHSAADTWSLRVLAQEIAESYNAQTEKRPARFADLTVRYIDHANWQRTLPEDVVEQLLFYWKRQLAGPLQALTLPTRVGRPAVHTYSVGRRTFAFSGRLSSQIDARGRAEHTGTFEVLLAAFNVLLHRYSGHEEIVVGTSVPCRRHAAVRNAVGPFANLLVLRSNLGGRPTFGAFLKQIIRTVDDARRHEDMPFDWLVKELNPQVDMSRTALFDVLFRFDDAPPAAITVGQTKAILVDTNLGHGKYDVNLSVQRTAEGFVGTWVYNTDLFDEFMIEQLAGHFEALLECFASGSDVPVNDVDLLSQAEKRTQLVDWNRTAAEYPREKTIHSIFEEQVARYPDRVAVVFQHTQLTYRQLDEESNRLANYLREQGVGRETLVALCLARSPDMIVAILGVLKAGGAYLPIDPDYPDERRSYIVNDSGVSHAISTSSSIGILADSVSSLILLDRDREAIGSRSSQPPAAHAVPDNIAYCIYTSGSTGRPKGVLLEHRQVVRLMVNDHMQFAFTEEDVWSVFHSYCFDFSVWEMYGALLYGGRLVIVSEGVNKDPQQFLGLILSEEVTVLNQTPSAFQQLMHHALSQRRTSVALRYIIFGGEALAPRQLQPWNRAYPDVKLVNMYGITETTVHVTFKGLEAEDLEKDGSNIGVPIPTLQTYLVDSGMRLLPVGVPGELHVGGAGLARNYLNRPELTAERFIPHPFGGPAGARLYKSGDLGLYLPNGEMEYLGRRDHQVKIRGFRIELGEIEGALSRHPALRAVAVVAREDTPGQVRLVAYTVAEAEPPGVTELRDFLKTSLPDYMVPAAFVALDALPLTSNGKVDRRALPAPETQALESAHVAPRSPVEEILADVWASVLGVPQVGVQSDFFELGGHSLLVTRVMSRVAQVFEVDLPLRTLFEHPTVAGLAAQVEAAKQGGAVVRAPSIHRRVDRGSAPLSFAQERLWFLDQLEPSGSAYVVPSALRLTGTLHVASFAAAYREVVRRHESLRTVIVTTGDGRGEQRITDGESIALEFVDLSSLAPIAREEEMRRLALLMARRPFDMASGPLVRATVLRLEDETHVALFSAHHIVTDGWSMGLIVRELTTLYPAFITGHPSPLAEPPIQYADYAVWQRNWLDAGAMDAQVSYWSDRLAGASGLLELPTDRPRPPLQGLAGASEPVSIAKDLSEALQVLSRREGVTPFMTLLAAFQTLLYKYSGQKTVLVGTPIAGRTRAEAEGLIGLFVNTLVMRADFDGALTFRDVLAQVRETALGAYAHQDLPFEKLVDELEVERDLSRTPLFQVMFALQNTPTETLSLPGLSLLPVEIEQATSKFDMTLSLAESPSGIRGTLEYSSDLFDAATIRRMVGHFTQLLEAAVAEPTRPVATLELLSTAERTQLLETWNATEEMYRSDACIPDVFQAQVALTPDAVAVVFEGRQLTYRQLDDRAARLASYLQSVGVGPEVRVGLCLDRSLDLVVGMLGILNAGGAYVALDPSYPEQRLRVILEDADVALVLTQAHLAHRFGADVQVLRIDADWPANAPTADCSASHSLDPRNLAYVMFTSGSTGRPKGVQIAHGSVVNFLETMRAVPGLDRDDTFVSVTTISFDISVLELLLPLTTGARLVVAGPDDVRDGGQLAALVERHQATAMQGTPATWRLVLDNGWSGGASLKALCGGEALSQDLASRLLSGARSVWNMYGPTETTVWSTLDHVEDRDAPTSIGHPIANTKVYVLDRETRLLPIGVPGELHIGGAGVSRGYRKRPDETAARFVPNPFDVAGGSRLYRTGDRVRYRPDGRIEFLGRIDHQVKIRGHRIELGEVETVLGQHQSIRDAVVVAREDAPGHTRLVAYMLASGDQPLSVTELQRHIRASLPEYMIPAAFVTLDAWPFTPNGKIDRRALPAPEQSRPELETAFIAPRDPREKTLAAIWSRVLGVDQLGVHDSFFHVGGDSILAIQIVARANEAGLRLTPRQIFEHQTIAELAAVAGVGEVAAEQGAVTGAVALTPIQRWFFESPPAEPHHFNQALLLEARARLDPACLGQSVASLFLHHDALRHRFELRDGEWHQESMTPDGRSPFSTVDLSSLAPAERSAEMTRQIEALHTSFDLGRGPLFHVRHFACGDEPDRVFLIAHHLVVDGVSWRILLEDLLTAYDQAIRGVSATLPRKTTALQHWARKLYEYVQSGALNEEVAYWQQQVTGEAPRLPVDRTDGPNTIASRAVVSATLTEEDSHALLTEVPEAYGTQINDVLLTALLQAFAPWTGSRALVVDLEGHGRESPFDDLDVSRTVGWFTTIFPVRLELPAKEDPGSALTAIKEQLRQIPQRGIGYGLLRYSEPARIAQLGDAPAEVIFNYLGRFDQTLAANTPFRFATGSSGPAQSPRARPRHLMEVSGIIVDGRLQLSLQYSENVHARATMQGLVDGIADALRGIIAHCLSPDAGGASPSDFPLADLDQATLDRLLQGQEY